MKIFARICSTIFHPLIIPTISILISLYFSYLCMLGDEYILTHTLFVAFFTILLPVIGVLILYKMKLITSVGLVNREERTLPYIIFFVCYVACAVYLWMNNLRGIQFGFFIGGIIALLCNLIINRQWKISVHMTSIGGFTGLIFVMSYLQYIMYTEYIPYLQVGAVLASGALGTSRILLRRHTLGQVVCGFFNGFFWIFISSYLFLLLTFV